MRRFLDRRRRLTGLRLSGARVLALAAGGGWDAVIFAKLGANTTLLDISRRQLQTVRALARRQRVQLRFVQGNMKDLSRFGGGSFDLVWHCHSMVFIDDARGVLREVGRVLAPGGTYVMSTMHPTTLRLYGTYTSQGWRPRLSYFGDTPIPYEDERDVTWEFEGKSVVAPTIEYGHRIETLINAMVKAGMVVDGLWEYSPDPPDAEAEPGSDEHLESLFPAFLEIRARKPRLKSEAPGGPPGRRL